MITYKYDWKVIDCLKTNTETGYYKLKLNRYLRIHRFLKKHFLQNSLFFITLIIVLFLIDWKYLYLIKNGERCSGFCEVYKCFHSYICNNFGNIVTIAIGVWTMIGSVIVYFMGRMSNVKYGFSLFTIALFSIEKKGFAVWLFDFLIIPIVISFSAIVGLPLSACAVVLIELIFLAGCTFYIACETRTHNVDSVIQNKTIILLETQFKIKQNEYFSGCLPLVTLICGCDYSSQHEVREIWRGIFNVAKFLENNTLQVKHQREFQYIFRSIIKNCNGSKERYQIIKRIAGLVLIAMKKENNRLTNDFDLDYYMEGMQANKLKQETCIVLILSILIAMIQECQYLGDDWPEKILLLYQSVDKYIRIRIYIPLLAFVEYMAVINATVDEGCVDFLSKLNGLYYAYCPFSVWSDYAERIENVLTFTLECWTAWFYKQEPNNMVLYQFIDCLRFPDQKSSDAFGSSFAVDIMRLLR